MMYDIYEDSICSKNEGQIEDRGDIALGIDTLPLMFAILMDSLTDEINQESTWTAMFVYDTVICSESKKQVS